MTPAGRERLGIFGGTFDPVHVGHLVAALETRHALDLDRVLLVVAGDPWQKDDVQASAEDRFAMVAAAVDGIDGLEASRVEIDRPGPTYTADTVAALASPDRDLFLVLGADAAARLDTWMRPEEIRAAVTLVVVDRAGDERPALDRAWRVEHVAIPRLDVSSTDLRLRIAQGRPIDFLVPAAAVRVLRERRLYTSSDGNPR